MTMLSTKYQFLKFRLAYYLQYTVTAITEKKKYSILHLSILVIFTWSTFEREWILIFKSAHCYMLFNKYISIAYSIEMAFLS